MLVYGMSIMGVSYEEVIVDVVRYKYLCDEGFVVPSSSPLNLACQGNGFYRHLVDCIEADTGIKRAIVERGLVHAAMQHGALNEAFFEAVVTRLYA